MAGNAQKSEEPLIRIFSGFLQILPYRLSICTKSKGQVSKILQKMKLAIFHSNPTENAWVVDYAKNDKGIILHYLILAIIEDN